MVASKSIGKVAVLRQDGDPKQPWKLTEIDRLPTSHRLRWADIDGSGKKVVINAPLTGEHAEAPDYRGHVPLVYYRPGEWKRVQIDDRNEGIVHGITVTDWDGDGRDEVLTASFLGMHLYKFGRKGNGRARKLRRAIRRRGPRAAPATSRSARRRERFLATIEPWHGNQVAVYRKQGGEWKREVIDDTSGGRAHDPDRRLRWRRQRRDRRGLSRQAAERVPVSLVEAASGRARFWMRAGSRRRPALWRI